MQDEQDQKRDKVNFVRKHSYGYDECFLDTNGINFIDYLDKGKLITG